MDDQDAQMTPEESKNARVHDPDLPLDDQGAQMPPVDPGDAGIDDPDLPAEAHHFFAGDGDLRRVRNDHITGSEIGQDEVNLFGQERVRQSEFPEPQGSFLGIQENRSGE